MTRTLLLALALTTSITAHVVSMSTGDLTVDGAHAHFVLRMPQYEVAHVAQPGQALLDHVRFFAPGNHPPLSRSPARMLSKECHADPQSDAYLCSADYEFDAPPGSLDVECTLAAITVPNHVHLLRAAMGGKHDQAVFDLHFTRATLRFRPPTRAEVAFTESAAGFLRALSGPVQILFLIALALAARTRRELLSLAAMFLLGQVLSVVIVPRTEWQPAARFVEAAAALTVAYLAVEILLLPKAGSRWLVAAILGVFHGLYFLLFIQNSDYHAGYVLAGAAIAELAVLFGLAMLFAKFIQFARAFRPVQVSASALLVFGMVWFFLRLRS